MIKYYKLMSKIIIIDGIEYDSKDKRIVDCLISGEKILYPTSTRLITGLSNIKTVKFNDAYEDQDINEKYKGKSFVRFLTTNSFVNQKYGLTDIESNLVLFKMRIYIAGEVVFYFKSQKDIDLFIKKYELLKGINRPNYYYFKEEIDYMDTIPPYRKFDNTFKKVTPEDVLKRDIVQSDYKNPEFHKLKASILKRNMQMGVDSISHNELEGIKYTLGYEIETVAGRLEEDEVEFLNMAAVHDGSLRGPDRESPSGGEYVTGVMYGDSGFKQLYDICRALNKKCKLDHRAGIHVHIGSLKWNNEDIVHAYLLGEIIENEMYDILPKSRKKNEYCRKLTKLFTKSDKLQLVDKSNNKIDYEILIDQLFGKVFKEVSGGYPPGPKLNSKYNHPKGSKCGFDKSTQRYCWLNFVTLMFDTKGGGDKSLTLEVRSHSATMNYKKIRNWAKIWVAFCNFVDNYKRFIKLGYIVGKSGSPLPLTLENICLMTYPKGGKELVGYIRERKQLFQSADESVDYPSESHEEKSIKEVINI